MIRAQAADENTFSGPALLPHLGRAALSLLVGAGLLWLLAARLSQIEPAEVALAFASLPAAAWALALGATAVSFWAAGQYDAVVHRHFATRLPQARARLAGICAIAVSQTIGLGVLTGAVLRWRMLPEIGPIAALRLTAAVALSFLGAWALVTSAVLTLLPGAPFKGPAALALALGLAGAALSLAAPRLGRLRLRWPNGMTLGKLTALCVVDTFAAALALWFLCPPGVEVPLALLLPAFLLAFGAGLVSGAPGGMGAFEMTLLALLPMQPQAGLLAAVLAWRLVYYALPAIMGAAIALRGPRGGALPQSDPDPSAARHSPCAEAGLLAQGEHRLIGDHASGIWLAGRTPHCLVGLFAPFAGSTSAQALDALEGRARAEERLAVLYKAPPRLAAAARARGYSLRRTAREAILDLARFDPALPACAGLRRKLRRAEAAGVTAAAENARALGPELAAIAAEWRALHGAERGFSMGRFAPDYVQGQRLFVARQDGRPIAFVTFHAAPREWTLDLMRQGAGAPDGTMHLLICTAIAAARAEGVQRLSLAAVPESLRLPHWLWPLRARDGAGGLERFKASFAPRWEGRYLCLPRAAHLPLAALEIARAVHFPGPLAPPARPGPAEIAFAPDG